MTVIGIILGSLFGIFAVLLIVVGALGWAAKLPGNPVVGIRVPEVRKSQEMWDMAHRVAGPLWVLSGVSFVIASLVAFVASGWMWLVVALGVVAGIVFIGMGAGMAAHTVAMVDAKRSRENPETPEAPVSAEIEEAGGVTITSPILNKTPQNAPKIDLDAVRRAAQTKQDPQNDQ
ncbi:hypothetical protein N24_3119 [Corynebacterium suranareeae]|uniref:Uncharacterized protein n=1 Tax=Corynebacterium suranareeae TaxID=2506452 RepID=A0A169SBK2_9CORY|nr:SdpI family protein [Corynebacterium suranareeae]BAU97381.1 hypothetical protein N24_3119 [Corynebacterium suranareeae]